MRRMRIKSTYIDADVCVINGMEDGREMICVHEGAEIKIFGKSYEATKKKGRDGAPSILYLGLKGADPREALPLFSGRVGSLALNGDDAKDGLIRWFKRLDPKLYPDMEGIDVRPRECYDQAVIRTHAIRESVKIRRDWTEPEDEFFRPFYDGDATLYFKSETDKDTRWQIDNGTYAATLKYERNRDGVKRFSLDNLFITPDADDAEIAKKLKELKEAYYHNRDVSMFAPW